MMKTGLILTFVGLFTLWITGCYTQEMVKDDYSVLDGKDVRAITVHTKGGDSVRSVDWRIRPNGDIDLIGGRVRIPRDSINAITYETLGESQNQVLAVVAVAIAIAVLISLPSTTIWPD